jgi:hypothetical protein
MLRVYAMLGKYSVLVAALRLPLKMEDTLVIPKGYIGNNFPFSYNTHRICIAIKRTTNALLGVSSKKKVK